MTAEELSDGDEVTLFGIGDTVVYQQGLGDASYAAVAASPVSPSASGRLAADRHDRPSTDPNAPHREETAMNTALEHPDFPPAKSGYTLLARRAKAAAIVLAALALPATVAAHVDPEPHDDAHNTAESEAIDVAIISADTGWSLAATRRHMADQQAFGDLQDEIEALYPGRFAGAEFAPAPGGRSFLRFKGKVPTGARTLATESELNVGVSGGRTYSATELASRTVAVVEFFGDAGYEQVGAAVLPGGQIEVAVNGASRPGSQLPPALRNGVHVTFADHEVAANYHTYGGAYIHEIGVATCTSGFSVESLITGEEGVVTAAHCDGMNHYHQPQGGPQYSMFEEDDHLGLNGDMAWYTTPAHRVEPEYYADPTDRREVNSVETSVAVNNTYCVYSRVQGTRTCDQVWATYTALLTFDGLASNLVGMDDNNNVHGDSGGPWSNGTEAAGIVTGYLWVPFQTHDVWTRAWLFDNSLDVVVQT